MDAAQSTVSRWLYAAGRRTGTDFFLHEDGHCHLTVGDGDTCIVEVPPGNETVYFYMPVARLPDRLPDAANALRVALSLNTFGIETGGSSFSYDERSEHIVLTFAAPIGMLDEGMFCSVLEEFTRTAVEAKAKYADSTRQSAPSEASAPLALAPFERA